VGLSPHALAETISAHATATPATLGRGRLICLDGPSGAGKTTTASALAALLGEATTVHTDDMIEGWRGLSGLPAAVDSLVRPLAAGTAGTWRRWDWQASCWAEHHTVEAGAWLILEGVGCSPRRIDDLITTLVWLDAPAHLRRDRWWRREGQTTMGFRDQWVLDEQLTHRRENTLDRADLVLDGSG
jgi:energy-coupling factor transporter ATP-binding protein EcfA2